MGVLFGSLSIFASVLGASLTFPFLQAQRDKLNCDVLCYGSMQSARSGLTMIGTILVGRMSDRLGRSKVLWIGTAASLFSYSVNLQGTSITAMWISLVPSSLLNQNFSVLKALFADYSSENGYSESERASAIGRLGMAVGLSFMVGPAIGAHFLSNYFEASLAAIFFTALSAVLLLFLPTPKSLPPSPSSNALSKLDEENEKDAKKEGMWRPLLSSFRRLLRQFFHLPVVQTPGARLLLFMRLMMALAFSVFMTVWTVSLKSRFDFGPKEHAYFMGWVGLCYAASQGFLARLFIRLCGEDSTILLLICISGLGLGRVGAMLTSSLVVVYIIMAVVIICLGIMNTAIASACSRLAGADQVGGLYGVMESVENLAGLVGPALGGVLFKINKTLPIVSVVFIYLCVFVAVWKFYRSTIIECKKRVVVAVLQSESEEVLPIGHRDSVTLTAEEETVAFKRDDNHSNNNNNSSEDVVVDDVTDVEVDLSEHEKEGNSLGSAVLSDEESVLEFKQQQQQHHVKKEEEEMLKLHSRDDCKHGGVLLKDKKDL